MEPGGTKATLRGSEVLPPASRVSDLQSFEAQDELVLWRRRTPDESAGYDGMDHWALTENKLVLPAGPLMPKPKQTRPNKQLRPPTASPASPDWWPKSSRLPSTSPVSERLI